MLKVFGFVEKFIGGMEINVKREEFRAKPTFDSLKSYKLFSGYEQVWNEETIEQHRKEMISLLRSHYTVRQPCCV